MLAFVVKSRKLRFLEDPSLAKKSWIRRIKFGFPSIWTPEGMSAPSLAIGSDRQIRPDWDEM